MRGLAHDIVEGEHLREDVGVEDVDEYGRGQAGELTAPRGTHVRHTSETTRNGTGADFQTNKTLTGLAEMEKTPKRGVGNPKSVLYYR